MTAPAAAPNAIAKEEDAFKAMMNRPDVKERFREVLGKEAGIFASTMLALYNGNDKIRQCSPATLLNAGFQAAAVHLPINANLGYASIIPYQNNKKVNGEWVKTFEAQFQIQWKGYVQLAHRTGQYKRLVLAPVYEGQLVRHDRFKQEVVLKPEGKTSDKVIGFYIFWRLASGLEYENYWPVSDCITHGLRYSKSFKAGFGPWTEDPNIKFKDGKLVEVPTWVHDKSGTFAMCAKTVIKNDLNKWGPLSTEIIQAMTVDQAVIRENGKTDYIDGVVEKEEGAEGAAPEPGRASEAGAAEATQTPKALKVEDVVPPGKKNREWAILIGGKSYSATEAVAKAAASLKAKGATVIIDATDSGILTEIQEDVQAE